MWSFFPILGDLAEKFTCNCTYTFDPVLTHILEHNDRHNKNELTLKQDDPTEKNPLIGSRWTDLSPLNFL